MTCVYTGCTVSADNYHVYRADLYLVGNTLIAKCVDQSCTVKQSDDDVQFDFSRSMDFFVAHAYRDDFHIFGAPLALVRIVDDDVRDRLEAHIKAVGR